MAETRKVPVDRQVVDNPAAAGCRKRRVTPKWIYLDMDRDEFVVEFPELEVKVSHPNYNEADRIAQHQANMIVLAAIRQKKPVPWKSTPTQPPQTPDLEVRRVAFAY
jgi:hypothetical protein